MKTPYDSALRLQQREVDEMRISISAEAGQLRDVELTRAAIGETLASESLVAAQDWTIASHHYAARMRSERARLEEQQRQIDARLDRLREKAMEAYGSLHAMERAAEQFRDDAMRSAAAAEQARIDDAAAAAFMQRLRVAREAVAQAGPAGRRTSDQP